MLHIFSPKKGNIKPDLNTSNQKRKEEVLRKTAETEETESTVQMAGEVRFLRCVSGNTLGSDEEFIRKLKEGIPGLKEEFNVEKCDFFLAFCPVVSRAGTDIQSALKKLQDLSESKRVVLVVLHHTFDQEMTVQESSRKVNRENTLTVDCLFHEDRGLLQCYRNQEALEKVTHWIKPPKKGTSETREAKATTTENAGEFKKNGTRECRSVLIITDRIKLILFFCFFIYLKISVTAHHNSHPACISTELINKLQRNYLLLKKISLNKKTIPAQLLSELERELKDHPLLLVQSMDDQKTCVCS
uniref:Uncharacterized protein n=1 Tax=Astyanax mexicanus TaxID=7994 RepID=W5LJY4_ASTMX